jgi:hypothetical protein
MRHLAGRHGFTIGTSSDGFLEACRGVEREVVLVAM